MVAVIRTGRGKNNTTLKHPRITQIREILDIYQQLQNANIRPYGIARKAQVRPTGPKRDPILQTQLPSIPPITKPTYPSLVLPLPVLVPVLGT